MILHLHIIGALFVSLALIHGIFPKYFNWGNELKNLSLINRQMMTVHTFFIALTVFLMGMLCLTSARDLVETTLGHKICLGLGLFWTVRLFMQLFVYSSALWKGKTFETVVHIFFTFLWGYCAFVFLRVYFN